MKVTSPSGATWRVSRRWLPWRRRTSLDPISGMPSTPSGLSLGDDPISMIFGVIILIVALPFLIVALVVMAAVALELLLLLLLLPLVILGRVLFGRAWRVEIRQGWEPVWETEAGGWRESGRLIVRLGQDLQQGRMPWRVPAGGSSPTPHQHLTGQPPPGQPPPPV